MSQKQARKFAQQNANNHDIVMVIGFQTNDVTGLNEYGYCPKSAVGPAFVHTVTEEINPE